MSGGNDEDTPKEELENHNHHDVLCGRGGGSYKHLGNSTYRHLVNLNKELYLSCKKHDKIKISIAIVSAIRSQDPPGRFLEKNMASGRWYDIGDKKAIEKTSQALREGAPKLRAKMSGADVKSPGLVNGIINGVTAGKVEAIPAVFEDETVSNEINGVTEGKVDPLHAPAKGKQRRRVGLIPEAPALKDEANDQINLVQPPLPMEAQSFAGAAELPTGGVLPDVEYSATGTEEYPDMVTSNMLRDSMKSFSSPPAPLLSLSNFKARHSILEAGSSEDLLNGIGNADNDEDTDQVMERLSFKSRSSSRISHGRLPKRSVFRGSNHSVLTDFSDISDAISAIHAEMAEEEDEDYDGESKASTRRTSVRFSLTKGPVGRRSAFALDEFSTTMKDGRGSNISLLSDFSAALKDLDMYDDDDDDDDDNKSNTGAAMHRTSARSRNSVRFSLPKKGTTSESRASIKSTTSGFSEIDDISMLEGDAPLMVWDVAAHQQTFS